MTMNRYPVNSHTDESISIQEYRKNTSIWDNIYLLFAEIHVSGLKSKAIQLVTRRLWKKNESHSTGSIGYMIGKKLRFYFQ
jgi:hypothetical protein